jgi:capsular exopolysaccharide synthesis family protein
MRLAEKPEEVITPIQQDDTGSTGMLPQIDLHECLQILIRQKRVILAAIAVIMFLTYVIASSLTPRYTATVLVEINARQSQVLDFDAVLTGLPADNETIRTEIAIIQSRKIARRAIERMDLNLDPEFNSKLRAVGSIEIWRQSLAEWLDPRDRESADGSLAGEGAEAEEPLGLVGGLMRDLAGFVSPRSDRSGLDEGQKRKELDATIDQFLKHLTVIPQRRSRVVEISFESNSPKIAAEAANTIADFYIVAQLEAKFEATKRATTWLNERVEQLRDEVIGKERAIEQYRAQFGLLQGGQEATLATEQISELNAQHILELARLAEAQARLRQANKLLNSPEGIETSVEVLQSPLIRGLRGQESLLEREIAELSEEYGDRHPTLLNKRAELRDLRTKIQLEVKRVIQGLRNEVSIARARVASLAASLDQFKQEMAQLNQSEVQLRALELDASASRTLLETLLERTKQTTSQESFQQADASVVSYAAEPTNPSFPRTSLILALALILAVAQGVFLAFAIEKLDLGFRSAEQTSRVLGLKPLGLLPKVSKLALRGKAPHDYVLERPESAFGESIRTLYTNLLLTDVVRRPKVIMIVSTLPQEGKSTVTLSLARMLATFGQRTIVVDCDLRRPSVHKKLGLKDGPGLVDCLTAGVRFQDVIEVDKESGAHVLRAGSSMRNSPDQLDSQLMQRLLRQLERQYDVVLLDSAPLLAVSDTLFLARLADKTIFLVSWAKTRRAAASYALKQVLAAKADVAGVLLTMVDVKSHAKYGYGDSGVYHGKLKKYYTE